ncbi:MAG TPA: glutamine amidotransferase [Bryobacteraceae bacterium]|nr:glutamine amidotransferase [Bryobacteraceae bacterium]
MSEFLFKYPWALFSKGSFVLDSHWPVWLLVSLIAAGAGALAWFILSRARPGMRGLRPAILWLFDSSLLALLLFLLWDPAISVATLRQQENIVAVVVDDSRSMGQADDRVGQERRLLESPAFKALGKKFQVRMYRMGASAEPLGNAADLKARDGATHIAAALEQVVRQTATLPVGGIVLLSDGADNSGGIDLDTMNELRRRRIPVHAIGFGPEHPSQDVELTDLQFPASTLANSRVRALVGLRQFGFAGRQVKLTVRDGETTLATREVALAGDGADQSEPIVFNAGAEGVRNVEIAVQPLGGEQNAANNKLTRVMYVDAAPRRVLFVEGEPRWEYKFIRRAVEDDKTLQLVSMLRTTENKIYRQGVANADELKDGFPSRVEDLFEYKALIIGSVEAGWFTTTQAEMIRQFVDRRGGGLLFLGGRWALADGGYDRPPFNDLLPVNLPPKHGTFFRDPAYPQLTPAGRDSLLCRIDDDPDHNMQRWKALPYLANYQEIGQTKPGATLLAQMQVDGRGTLPLLATENYGRGRTAVFATAGSWRWQMLQPLADMSHEIFWRQMLRWLVTETPSRVTASTPHAVLYDDGAVKLRAEVRDTTYLPTSDAQVSARIIAPDGHEETVDLRPDAIQTGVYTGEWNAPKPGSYIADITARRGQQDLGKDVVTFRREDGVAENFHLYQNRDLLEKLAADTGGKYWKPAEVSRLPEDIAWSEAGISVRETHDLWDAPIMFLLALALRSGGWLLRRRWGAV